MSPRLVKIERFRDSWLVLYVERKKGQRYTAAQFYAPTHTLEDVQNYIKTKPNLILNATPNPRSNPNMNTKIAKIGQLIRWTEEDNRGRKTPLLRRIRSGHRTGTSNHESLL